MVLRLLNSFVKRVTPYSHADAQLLRSTKDVLFRLGSGLPVIAAFLCRTHG